MKKIMSLDEVKATDWYKSMPKVIKEAIEIMPPTQYYRFKSTNKQCYIVAYNEHSSGKLEDVTLIVYKTGVGGAMNLGALDQNLVADVKFDDLEAEK